MRLHRAGHLAIALTALTGVIAPRAAVAQTREDHEAIADPDLDRRLDFLRRRINAEHRYATIWWGTWVGIYSAGVVAQSWRMGMATSAASRADLLISSIKAMGGLMRLSATPMNGIEGQGRPECAPSCSREEKLDELRRAERILERNAHRVERNHAWYTHVANIGVNAAGGLIVALGYGAPTTAAISAGLGAAVGEVMLFTQPSSAPDDLADYRAGMPAPPPPKPIRWRVSPLGAGAAFEVAF